MRWSLYWFMRISELCSSDHHSWEVFKLYYKPTSQILPTSRRRFLKWKIKRRESGLSRVMLRQTHTKKIPKTHSCPEWYRHYLTQLTNWRQTWLITTSKTQKWESEKTPYTRGICQLKWLQKQQIIIWIFILTAIDISLHLCHKNSTSVCRGIPRLLVSSI